MKEFILLTKIFDIFANQIHKDLAMPQARMLIYVANQPGISTNEICKYVGLTQSTVQRNMDKLGKRIVQNAKGEFKDVGYGLIYSKIDVDESRRHLFYCTKKGERFIKDLVKKVGEIQNDIYKKR